MKLSKSFLIGIFVNICYSSELSVKIKGKSTETTLLVDGESSYTKSYCRSLGDIEVSDIEKNDAIEEIKCFKEFGCAGKVINDLEGTVPKSCKLVPKSVQNKGSGNFTVPAQNMTAISKAAILYSETKYQGNKHWVDGALGECRGLSGAPVESVKMIPFPGASESLGVQDEVTLAFYDDYGCSGNLIGAVTGEHPDINTSIEKTIETKTSLEMEDEVGSLNGNGTIVYPGNSTYTSSGKILAKSVRFVKTGIENKYYSMKYDGIVGETSSAIKNNPLFITILASMILTTVI